MKRLFLLAALLFSTGCFLQQSRLRPVTLAGDEITIVQSKYRTSGTIDEYYTNAEKLKISITVEKARPDIKRTVLWIKQQKSNPWQRIAFSEPYESEIPFEPVDGRYYCYASVVYSDGTSEFEPLDDTKASFCLVVDRTKPQITINTIGKLLANTTADLTFHIYDEGLGPAPTADLYISHDNGATWQPRAAVMPVENGENTYGYWVPSKIGGQHLVKIISRDYTGNSSEAITEQPFEILPHPSAKEALLKFIGKDDRKKKPNKTPGGASPGTPGETPGTSPGDNTARSPGTSPGNKTVPGPGGETVSPGNITETKDDQKNPITSLTDNSDNTDSLRIIAPDHASPGQIVPVRVEHLEAYPTAEPRLFTRDALTAAWAPLDKTVRDKQFLWKCPDDDSQHTFKLELYDTSGTKVAECISNRLSVDGTPPKVTVHASPSEDDPRNVTITVKATDPEPDSEISWVRLSITRDGGASWSSLPVTNQSVFEHTMKREDKTIGFFAHAEDNEGNTSPAPIKGTVPLTTIGPRPEYEITLFELSEPVLKGGDTVFLSWKLSGPPPPLSTNAFVYTRDDENTPWRQDAIILYSALKQNQFLWTIPDKTCAALRVRIELELSEKTAIPSNPIGPYAVAADPPLLVPIEKAFLSSNTVTIPFTNEQAGPAGLSSVTVYVRPKPAAETTQWVELQTTHQKDKARIHCFHIPEGRYALLLQGTDQCGNHPPPPDADTPGQAQLVIDRTPPVITVDLQSSLSSPYYEGVENPLSIKSSEDAELALFLKAEDQQAETVILRRQIEEGVAMLSFSVPLGFQEGMLRASATDAAGNRKETPWQQVSISPALKFAGDNQNGKTIREQQLPVRYTIAKPLLETGPTIWLYYKKDVNSPRELMAKELAPVSFSENQSYTWVLPEGLTHIHTLEIEAQKNGIVKARASEQVDLQCTARNVASVSHPPVIPAIEVDPESKNYSSEGMQFLELAQETLQQGASAEQYTTAKTYIDRSRESFTTAILKDKNNTTALFGLARLCFKPFVSQETRFTLEEAETHLEKVLGITPNHFDSLLRLGVTRIKMGRYKEAESPLGKAANLKPENTTVRYNLGLAQLKQGDYTDALTDFKKAATGTPSIPQAYKRIIECHLLNKDFDDANTALNTPQAKQVIDSVTAEKIKTYIKQHSN